MQDIEEDFLLSRKKIFNATLIVILAILLSKISGLVRDQVMAGYFGISYETDAYTWAFFIPNLFKILFAESLITAAFIPVYTSYLKHRQNDRIQVFVNSVLNIMVLFFLAVSLILFIFSPQIGALLSRIAGNQLDLAKFIMMNRIMAFSVILLSLSGLTSGILNAHNLFAVPSFAPFVLNIFIVSFVVFLSRKLGIISMAIGTMAGSLAQLLVQIPQIKVARIRLNFRISVKDKAVREIFSLMGPIMLSLGAVQLNNSVDKFFALGLGPGNTTALDISWRVTNLPLGVFSVAIITVLYPLISRQAASGDIDGIKESFSLGVREILYIMTPAVTGLILLSYPVIKLLFEHNNFTASDTEKVSFILIFHSLGLIFFGLLMILNRIYYAFRNVRTPLIVALFSILANVFLDWLLIKYLGVAGVALSTSLVAVFNVVTLLIILRKKTGCLGGKRILKSLLKIIAASAVMGAVIYLLWYFLKTYAYGSLLNLAMVLVLIILTGAGVYVLLTFLFKMDEIRFAFGIVKNLKKSGRN